MQIQSSQLFCQKVLEADRRAKSRPPAVVMYMLPYAPNSRALSHTRPSRRQSSAVMAPSPFGLVGSTQEEDKVEQCWQC